VKYIVLDEGRGGLVLRKGGGEGRRGLLVLYDGRLYRGGSLVRLAYWAFFPFWWRSSDGI